MPDKPAAPPGAALPHEPVKSVVLLTCPVCMGDGFVEHPTTLAVHTCRTCAGRGRIATEGGEP
jgi:DnaJ-class molecular chaperone